MKLTKDRAKEHISVSLWKFTENVTQKERKALRPHTTSSVLRFIANAHAQELSHILQRMRTVKGRTRSFLRRDRNDVEIQLTFSKTRHPEEQKKNVTLSTRVWYRLLVSEDPMEERV